MLPRGTGVGVCAKVHAPSQPPDQLMTLAGFRAFMHVSWAALLQTSPIPGLGHGLPQMPQIPKP